MPRRLEQRGGFDTHQRANLGGQPAGNAQQREIHHQGEAIDQQNAVGAAMPVNNAGYAQPVVNNNAVGANAAAMGNNVNPVQVAMPTIANQEVPLVIFVGPSRSGKSMILVRLSQYLRNTGLTIKTDPTFLNTQQYLDGCNDFNDKLNKFEALDPTTNFLLVDVYDGSRLVAKLLEAPGEDFYSFDNDNDRNNRIEPYLSTIVTSPNPKAYVMLLDLDSDVSFRRNPNHRSSYAA